MKSVFIAGAGRSSPVLINYLLHKADELDLQITVGDISIELAKKRINGHPRAKAVTFYSGDEVLTDSLVFNADIVVSLLPPTVHHHLAVSCIKFGKHLVTASYVNEAMQSLHQDALNTGITILCEMGLDPGIDHMSAMELIQRIKDDGGKITGFWSYTGGLPEPGSNNNPWGYKISWNPRNVVSAGKGTAVFLSGDKIRYVPYNRLFQHTKSVSVNGCGDFEGYPNRDSLSYLETYGLNDISTLIRGTLRNKGFCSAWNIIVNLGLTDETCRLKNNGEVTLAGMMESLLPENCFGTTLRQKVASFSGLGEHAEEMDMIEWLGLFSDKKIDPAHMNFADVMQEIIENKWKIEPDEKDMIVMQHRFKYTKGGKTYESTAELVVKGINADETAMAKTVGLPLAIACELLLANKIEKRGVVIPTVEEVFVPVLQKLNEHGILFKHTYK